MHEYTAKIIRVVDGDTIKMQVDLGFGVTVKETFRIVFRGGGYFNTPETSLRGGTTFVEKQRGLNAKEYAEALLPVGTTFTIKTYKVIKGKFGRYLASIDLQDRTDFAIRMTKEGYGTL